MESQRIFQILTRPWIRWALVSLVVGIVLFNTAIQIRNSNSSNQTVPSGHFGINFLLILLTVVLLYSFRHLRTPNNHSRLRLSGVEIEKLNNFKQTQKQLKKIRRKSKRELKAKEREFADLSSPKGNQIASLKQIKVFERWIETPHGSCSIIGVKATTRSSSFYENLILENLEFADRLVFAAGKEAGSIAKKINNAAQSAERNHVIRLRRLRVLPSEISALQNDTRIDDAEKLFASADESLDEEIKVSLKKRNSRLRLSVITVCLLGAVTSVGISYPIVSSLASDISQTTKTIERKATPTNSTQTPKPPEILTMPNIVGLSYAVAYEEISSAGRHLDYIDVLEKRSVWDNENWVVVQQIPEPGTKVSQVEKICAGVTKIAEKWRTPQHFGCWSEVYSDVKPVSISRDVMYLDIDFSNSHDNGHQYRATVEIDTDDGETLKVMYCTEEATAPSGKVGRMRLSGKYFVDDAVIFNNYVGRFAYSISKFESQLGNIPC